MNVNVKVSLTDEQRNTLYRRMTGKNVKRMVSRKEVCELVDECIASMLAKPKDMQRPPATPTAPWREIYANPDDEPQVELDLDGAHPDCCRANELLRTRMNRLQHRLDTGRP